jgi:Fungal specific transcription factor domain
MDRLDRLTSLVEALSKGKGTEGDHADVLPSEFGLRQERNDANRTRGNSVKYSNGCILGNDSLHPIPSRLNRAVEGLDMRSVGADHASKTSDFDIPTADAAELEDPMSKMNLGFLSVQEGGRTRYVGSTFWAYVSDEIDQLNTLLRDQNRYHSTNGITNNQHLCEPCGEIQDQGSPGQDSDDSLQHNSFHKAGDHAHVKNSQFRRDCAACLANATDKSILLQSLDSHPSRFRRMDNDMAAGFPTQIQSHILFRCWLSGVHGHIPLVYPPLALKKYEAVWEWYNNGKHRGEPHPEPSFMPLLYAIWYAGSVSISLNGLRAWFPGVSRAKLSAGFHDQITRSLMLVSFPKNPSIPALAAFLMLQMILAKEEEPLTSSLYVSLAIRVAQTLGLHRDPTLFNFPAWEVESRRRLWWQIVLSDCYIAVASGLPPLISDGFFDTKMISEVKDVKLGTKEAYEYEVAVEKGERPRDNPDNPINRTRTSMVQVTYVVARGKYIMTQGLRRLLKIQLGTKPMTRGDMREMRRILSEVDHDLNEIIQRIPTKGIPEMGFTPDRDENGHSLVSDFDPELAQQPTEDDIRPFVGMTPQEGLNENTIRYHWNTMVAFHKWARIMLSLTIDKIYCVSYAPFLRNAKSKLWPAARQCALRHCHAYMRKFISLATDPAFQPFQWSWPGMHQPMQAAMIMLVDLYERPTSIEAPRSRAFIDKIFSMSGPDGGIVSGEDGVTVQRPLREGGREAWDMLRRLREKAWQKAGLDPDVLWTEEDQIRAGVATPLTDSQKIAQSLREDTIHTGITDVGIKMSGVILDMLRNTASESNATIGSAPSADPAPRPKTLQRLSTMQQRTPFRSTTQRPSTHRTPTLNAAAMNVNNTDNNTNNNTDNTASTTTSSFPSNADNLQTPYTAPTSNPVPQMPPPPTSYFNPPTAVSSNAAHSSEPSTIWSPSPNQLLAESDTENVTYNNPQPPPTYPAALHPHHRQPAGGNSGGAAMHALPSAPTYAEVAVPLTPTVTTTDQHFDWDQWDAVFGQHLGLDDMVMEDVGEAWGDDGLGPAGEGDEMFS